MTPFSTTLAQEPASGIAGWAAGLVDTLGGPGAGLAIALENRDPAVPVEDTVGATHDLVTGKIGHLGLSEVSADTLCRACATGPVVALQSEYSLFTRALECEILPTADHLGVTAVAYSPLGRGLLTGTLTSTGSLHRDDVRRAQPRFRGANVAANLTLVQRLRGLADEVGCTLAQLALAWLLAAPSGSSRSRAPAAAAPTSTTTWPPCPFV
ncbi:aldo/keto reductase [Streptomyces kutzneri]|uniref:aldo/keto reductase n=1 Tax=Streptomyces kutzneri TaxID=3051179 RepID=UPI0028D800A7|nr:aldo/keto reductase [Streptomyces sp. DSM 40907]